MLEKLKALLGRIIYRSSQTGRFVSKSYAEKHPDVTEKERL